MRFGQFFCSFHFQHHHSVARQCHTVVRATQVRLAMQDVPVECRDNDKTNDGSYQLRWDKANLHQYDILTHNYLDALGLSYAIFFSTCSMGCSCGNLWMIDDYYRKIVSALTSADATCVPRKRVGFYKIGRAHV